MRKVIFSSLLVTSVALTGCAVNLAEEKPIPPAPIVKNPIHSLSEVNKKEITEKFLAYQAATAVGIASILTSLADARSYDPSVVDMAKIDVYDCQISRILGDYNESYFHRGFLISRTQHKSMYDDKDRSVLMNYNNVNDYKVYEDVGVYEHKDGGFGIAIVDHNSPMSNLVAINYKCDLVPNKLF